VSLGKHTMPHGLAKLVMLEQCYRVWTLGMNKKYHY
jgi:23S rRNA pseudoU1915 N3-methylase RlmH